MYLLWPRVAFLLIMSSDSDTSCSSRNPKTCRNKVQVVLDRLDSTHIQDLRIHLHKAKATDSGTLPPNTDEEEELTQEYEVIMAEAHARDNMGSISDLTVYVCVMLSATCTVNYVG